jgi:hypothetical protein
LDIGKSGVQDYDAAAELAFVGAGNGQAVKWYDQSGNAQDMSQAAGDYAPISCESGVLVPGPTAGRYGNRHVNFRLFQRASAWKTPNGNWSAITVYSDDDTGNNSATAWALYAQFPKLARYNTSSHRVLLYKDGGNYLNNSLVAPGSYWIVVTILNGVNSILSVNGQEVTGDAGTILEGALEFGRDALHLRMCEFIGWTGVISADQKNAAIANAKAYWGITW